MADNDVLRALAQEALERGTHPDRERVLRDFVGDDEEDTDKTGDASPSTAPQRGRSK